MSRLKKCIEEFEHYEKKFSEWEATELIIDDAKAFWMLNQPGSSVQKVCLFRDGNVMTVYGDYGSFIFDSMTWLGDVYNLEYNNIGYQKEKLSRDSISSMLQFDQDNCEKDLMDWLHERLEEIMEDEDDEELDKKIKLIEDFVSESQSSYYFDSEAERFGEENGLSDEIVSLISFILEAKSNMDENDWVCFLRNSNLDDFEEKYESSLWSAGLRFDQRYFVCLYALQVCGEKLTAAKKEKEEI